ncbi:putative RNA-directed DNA polymerase [Aphis craccivora]|uniref:Putative RNA-directed DNA polymerase n=1 Tax=Aphis craccivora TaxID=307492 RepID=A0A6G0YYM6_APHCR|nr:putative RNA-directed DNA polymerase [Aphis craccivora]
MVSLIFLSKIYLSTVSNTFLTSLTLYGQITSSGFFNFRNPFSGLHIKHIKEISKLIPKPIIPILYADDFSILCRSSSLITIKQILQDATDSLRNWSNSAGFRFSAEKN